MKLSTVLFSTVLTFCLFCSYVIPVYSQSHDLSPSGINEQTVVGSMVSPSLIERSIGGGAPNSAGLVGSNQSGWVNSANQRGAMDRLTGGIFLNNIRYIEDGIFAVETTYKHQTSSGNFNDKPGDVAFWMGWSNHAIWVLKNSSHWSQFRNRIEPLYPQMERAMDYLMSNSSILRSSTDAIAPNRTLITANALCFAYLLLNNSDQTRRDSWLAEGKWWIDNEFNNDKLFRSLDGVFKEAEPQTRMGGYDTGYHGVALWFMMKLMIHFKNPTANASEKMRKAGHWLAKRILSDGTIDCTYNTRSGPNNIEGSPKTTDMKGLLRGLWYNHATLNNPEAHAAAERARTSMSGLPPTIFSSLTTTAIAGQTFRYKILATNAGANSMEDSFLITAENLPSGLGLATEQEFYKSTGTRDIYGVIAQEGEYYIKLNAQNLYGVGTDTLTLKVLPDPTVIGRGTGLAATYYDNIDFTGTQVRRVDPTVNFNWKASSPIRGIGANTFSVHWSGYIEAPASGEYRFISNSDDGVRLWINGKQIVNNWTSHGATENSGSINLSKGEKYSIRLEYYENTGNAVIQLSWEYAGQTKQIIPQSRFYK